MWSIYRWRPSYDHSLHIQSYHSAQMSKRTLPVAVGYVIPSNTPRPQTHPNSILMMAYTNTCPRLLTIGIMHRMGENWHSDVHCCYGDAWYGLDRRWCLQWIISTNKNGGGICVIFPNNSMYHSLNGNVHNVLARSTISFLSRYLACTHHVNHSYLFIPYSKWITYGDKPMVMSWLPPMDERSLQIGQNLSQVGKFGVNVRLQIAPPSHYSHRHLCMTFIC